MFSTDFIFRQQEDLVDNHKCQAGFRPLCNKILFLSECCVSTISALKNFTLTRLPPSKQLQFVSFKVQNWLFWFWLRSHPYRGLQQSPFPKIISPKFIQTNSSSSGLKHGSVVYRVESWDFSVQNLNPWKSTLDYCMKCFK